MKKKTLILLHGGPGYDDSYFFPYFDSLKSTLNIHSYIIGETQPKCTLDNLIMEFEDYVNTFNQSEVYVLGHSFGGLLALSSNKKTMDKLSGLILSNWIYDLKWLDIFFARFPNELDYKAKCLEESAFHYLKYNFKDLELGKEIIKRIKFNDKTYDQCKLSLNYVNIEYNLNNFSQKMISISGQCDKVVTTNYILSATNKFNITNYEIPNAGHFPFTENGDVFFDLIKKFII